MAFSIYFRHRGVTSAFESEHVNQMNCVLHTKIKCMIDVILIMRDKKECVSRVFFR